MQKIKILIVEDDNFSVEIINNILKNDYEVKIATDGIIGLKAYKEFQPNIIITDLNMPNENGLKMLEKIRKFDKKTRIIVTTAHKDINYLMNAIELNLSKYLVKPLNKNDLLDAIKLAIEDLKNFDYVSKKVLVFQGDYYWDINKKTFFKNEKEIKLTPKERDLIDYLIQNLNFVKTYDDILYAVWNSNEYSDKNSLKTLISALKKKLPENLIENIYGEGYRISSF